MHVACEWQPSCVKQLAVLHSCVHFFSYINKKIIRSKRLRVQNDLKLHPLNPTSLTPYLPVGEWVSPAEMGQFWLQKQPQRKRLSSLPLFLPLALGRKREEGSGSLPALLAPSSKKGEMKKESACLPSWLGTTSLACTGKRHSMGRVACFGGWQPKYRIGSTFPRLHEDWTGWVQPFH